MNSLRPVFFLAVLALLITAVSANADQSCKPISKSKLSIEREALADLADARRGEQKRSWWIAGPMKAISTLGGWMHLSRRAIRHDEGDIRWEFLGVDPALGNSRAVTLMRRERLDDEKFAYKLCRMSLREATDLLGRDNPKTLLKRAGYPADQRDEVRDQLMAYEVSPEIAIEPKPVLEPKPVVQVAPVVKPAASAVVDEPFDEDQKIIDAYLKQ